MCLAGSWLLGMHSPPSSFFIGLSSSARYLSFESKTTNSLLLVQAQQYQRLDEISPTKEDTLRQLFCTTVVKKNMVKGLDDTYLR